MSVYADHLLTQVLPWWETHALAGLQGPAAAGVRTGFANDGTLHTTDRFTWSQGRWAWLAAELADDAASGTLPVDEALWHQRCLSTCERMVAESLRTDHRTHFRVTEAGKPVVDDAGESATSVFADLFLVLGLAGGLRRTDPADERHRTWETISADVLQTALAAIEARTATSEPYPVPPGFTDMAGPMTVLHTAAEVLRAPFADDDARARVRAARDRAMDRLLACHVGPDHWSEFTPTDPALEGTLLARHRTPGHLLELLWMIDHAQHQDPQFHALSDQTLVDLARWAVDVGTDRRHGGLLRYTDEAGGGPDGPLLSDSPYEDLVRATWDTKLWWVHVEAVYALQLLARRDPSLRDAATALTEWTFTTFPDPDNGEWLQIRDRAGAPLEKVVALPVKDPFHIIRALILLHRLERDTPLPTPETTPSDRPEQDPS